MFTLATLPIRKRSANPRHRDQAVLALEAHQLQGIDPISRDQLPLGKEQHLSDLDRLWLHQAQSQPVMDQLHQWMEQQFEQKKIEPNSGLGQAIRYMLKHWEPLTRFLSVPGAPLDNNAVERALKMSILHRKNSLAFMTTRGARIGDIFMSIIHTCELNQINPFALPTEPLSWARSLRRAAKSSCYATSRKEHGEPSSNR